MAHARTNHLDLTVAAAQLGYVSHDQSALIPH
jgi:hypothetical protein